MKKKSLFIFTTLLLSFSSWGQNLVPNPSFEEYSSCPTNYGQTDLAGWSININTADFFNKCANGVASEIGVPSNTFGTQSTYDINCNGYAGFGSYFFTEDYSEYIGVQLLDSLTIGLKYYVSFKIVLANCSNVNCGVNKLGMKFTNFNYGHVSLGYPAPIMNNFAHVYTENIIIQQNVWDKINGSFIADSAYKFAIIGRFFNDNNTTVNCFGNNLLSYYYIDDVCVSTDSAYCWDYNFTCSTNTSTDITNNYSIDIFPNPAENYFHIEIDKTTYKKKPKIEIYTALGKLVHKQQLNEINTKINTTGLKSGLYFVKIYCSNCNSVKKLIIK